MCSRRPETTRGKQTHNCLEINPFTPPFTPPPQTSLGYYHCPLPPLARVAPSPPKGIWGGVVYACKGLAQLPMMHLGANERGNVSAPGARRASFVTRALPVDCCR